MPVFADGMIQENQLSDEEYVIYRTKNSQKQDAATAKAWMITAKTLFPRNFSVQVGLFILDSWKVETLIQSGHDLHISDCCFSRSLKHTLLRSLQTTLKRLLDTFLACKLTCLIYIKLWTNNTCICFRFFDFPNEAELWEEVQGITAALQSDEASLALQFHRDLFSHMLTGNKIKDFCHFVMKMLLIK